MEIFKIVSIGLVSAFCALLLKEEKGEIALMIAISGSILILLIVLNYVMQIFVIFDELLKSTGIDSGIFKIILKIVGIGFIVDFSAGICEDAGQKVIGDKIILGGKVMILYFSLPIILQLFQIIAEILQ